MAKTLLKVMGVWQNSVRQSNSWRYPFYISYPGPLLDELTSLADRETARQYRAQMFMSLVSPLQKLAGFQEEIQFEVLRRLHQTPLVSQRAIAKDLGVGLGTINFCFQTLVEKGLVEMQNFSQRKNMLRYAYLLTPAGLAQKSRLTAEFLRRKVAEYEALRVEIEVLMAEIDSSPEFDG